MSSTPVLVSVAADSVEVGMKMALRRPLTSTPGGMESGMSVLLGVGGLGGPALVDVQLGGQRATIDVDRVLLDDSCAEDRCGLLAGGELGPVRALDANEFGHGGSPLSGIENPARTAGGTRGVRSGLTPGA